MSQFSSWAYIEEPQVKRFLRDQPLALFNCCLQIICHRFLPTLPLVYTFGTVVSYKEPVNELPELKTHWQPSQTLSNTSWQCENLTEFDADCSVVVSMLLFSRCHLWCLESKMYMYWRNHASKEQSDKPYTTGIAQFLSPHYNIIFEAHLGKA